MPIFPQQALDDVEPLPYQPWRTLDDLQCRLREALAVPTTEIWDSLEALEADTQITVVKIFERLQDEGDGHDRVTERSRLNLLRAAAVAPQSHWSDTYYRTDAAWAVLLGISAWIDAGLEQ